MKKLILVLFVLVNLLSSKSYGQAFEKTMIGDKLYDSSKEIDIDPCGTSGVKIKILKNGISGYIVFLCESDCSEMSHIWGIVSLYLDDNSVIKLTDKKKYDCVNQIAYTIYEITPANIVSLKKTNINAIRFKDKYMTALLIYNKDCTTELHLPVGSDWSTLPEPGKKIMLEQEKIQKYNYTTTIKSLFK